MVYVTGDMHGELDRFKASAIKKLRKGDTLIVCGDFGFVWDGGKGEQHILKQLGNRKYNLAFLDGVYENHPLLAQYPVTEWNGGKVHNITGRLFHLMRGQVYNIDSKIIFTLGGGQAPEAELENPNLADCLPTIDDLYEANRNLQRYDYVVDYVLTHDCTGTVKSFLNMDNSIYSHLHAFLNEAAKIINYKQWFFGCLHLDKPIPPKYVAVFKEIQPLP